MNAQLHDDPAQSLHHRQGKKRMENAYVRLKLRIFRFHLSRQVMEVINRPIKSDAYPAITTYERRFLSPASRTSEADKENEELSQVCSQLLSLRSRCGKSDTGAILYWRQMGDWGLAWFCDWPSVSHLPPVQNGAREHCSPHQLRPPVTQATNCCADRLGKGDGRYIFLQNTTLFKDANGIQEPNGEYRPIPESYLDPPLNSGEPSFRYRPVWWWRHRNTPPSHSQSHWTTQGKKWLSGWAP